MKTKGVQRMKKKYLNWTNIKCVELERKREKR